MKDKLIREIIDDEKRGMTLIVKTVARMMIAMVLLFGFYVILYGHLTPGGGFAGGVILAIGYTLMMLAFSKDMALKKFSNFWSSMFDNMGMLAFLLIGFVGFWFGSFMVNFVNHGTEFSLLSGGYIPLANLAIGIKVGAALYAIFISLSIYGRLVLKGQED